MLYCQAICVFLLLVPSGSYLMRKVPFNADLDLAGLQEKKECEQSGGQSKPTNCGGGDKSCIGDAKSKASCIAQKAAQEAKAANDAQLEAGEAASQHVKLELAEKALQAARAAEAALAGKQQIMEALEQDQVEAEAVVVEVDRSLTSTTANAEVAANALRDAKDQVDKLKSLFASATDQMQNIEAMASGAQMELAEKTQLLEAAKRRVETITHQLNTARQDFDRTKQAAYKAACAAVEAKQKAQGRRARQAVSPLRPSLKTLR